MKPWCLHQGHDKGQPLKLSNNSNSTRLLLAASHPYLSNPNFVPRIETSWERRRQSLQKKLLTTQAQAAEPLI